MEAVSETLDVDCPPVLDRMDEEIYATFVEALEGKLVVAVAEIAASGEEESVWLERIRDYDVCREYPELTSGYWGDVLYQLNNYNALARYLSRKFRPGCEDGLRKIAGALSSNTSVVGVNSVFSSLLAILSAEVLLEVWHARTGRALQQWGLREE